MMQFEQTYFKPGDAPDHFVPGNIILTMNAHHWYSPKGFLSAAIRFGQRLKFRGANAIFAKYNHAAIIINEQGDILEALAGGITESHISKYTSKEYTLITTGLSTEDVVEALAFANHFLNQDYGFLVIASNIFTLLTGMNLVVSWGQDMICSEFVARCMERGKAIFDKPPSHMMPADLAAYYNVRM